MILQWADKFPGCNWGWIPGKSGHAVVDMDRRNEGDAALKALENEHGSLPDTERTLTADGVHSVFWTPKSEQLSACLIAPGLELKTGPIAHVLVPGAVHPSGHVYHQEAGYELGEIDIAELPAWIVQIADGDTQSRRSTPVVDAVNFDPNNSKPLDRDRLARHLEPGTYLFKIWHRDERIGKDRSLSGWTFRACRELHKLGYDIDDAHPVLVQMFGEWNTDYPKLFDQKWMCRTWSKATNGSSIRSRESKSLRRTRDAAVLIAVGLTRDVAALGGTFRHVEALMVLARYSNNGICHMTGARLASEMGCHDSTGRRYLTWLKNAGYIRALSKPVRPAKGRAGRAIVWDLVFLSDQSGRNAAEDSTIRTTRLPNG